MREHIKQLATEAHRLGAKDLRIDWRGRHPALVGFRPAGSRFRMVISGTPSCPRTVLNERTRLRRKFAVTAEVG